MIKKVIAILFISTRCWATYSVISHVCTGSTDGGSSVTTSAINTTGSDLIIVGISYLASGTPGTLSSSPGNTFTALNSYSGGSGAMKLFYVASPTTGASQTFSLGVGAFTFPVICVLAVSGSAASPFDNQNGNSNALAASLQTGSLTPSENSEIQVSMLGQCAGGSTSNHTIDSSFTISDDLALNSGQSCGAGLAYKIKADTTAENPTWSWTGNDGCGADIAGFKAAASGGSTSASRSRMMCLEMSDQL